MDFYLLSQRFFLSCAVFLNSCALESTSPSADVSVNEPSSLVGSPNVLIPAIAVENRIKLAFSSKIKLELEDERSDKLALGPSLLRLASPPIFSVRFALDKTLRSLGYKVGDDGSISFSGTIHRFEFLSTKTPNTAQAYIRISFSVKDPLGTPLLQRDYEGSSSSTGSAEQKLGGALGDILAQISIDKELQTVLASF